MVIPIRLYTTGSSFLIEDGTSTITAAAGQTTALNDVTLVLPTSGNAYLASDSYVGSATGSQGVITPTQTITAQGHTYTVIHTRGSFILEDSSPTLTVAAGQTMFFDGITLVLPTTGNAYVAPAQSQAGTTPTQVITAHGHTYTVIHTGGSYILADSSSTVTVPAGQTTSFDDITLALPSSGNAFIVGDSTTATPTFSQGPVASTQTVITKNGHTYTAIHIGGNYVLEESSLTTTLTGGQTASFDGIDFVLPSFGNAYVMGDATQGPLSQGSSTTRSSETVITANGHTYTVIHTDDAFIIEDASATVTVPAGQTTVFDGASIVLPITGNAFLYGASTTSPTPQSMNTAQASQTVITAGGKTYTVIHTGDSFVLADAATAATFPAGQTVIFDGASMVLPTSGNAYIYGDSTVLAADGRTYTAIHTGNSFILEDASSTVTAAAGQTTTFDELGIVLPLTGNAYIHDTARRTTSASPAPTATQSLAGVTTSRGSPTFSVVQQGSSFLLEDASTTIAIGPGATTVFEGQAITFPASASAVVAQGVTYTLKSFNPATTDTSCTVSQQGGSFVLKDASTTITIGPGSTTQFEGQGVTFPSGAAAIVFHSSTYTLTSISSTPSGSYSVYQQGGSFVLKDASTTITLGPGSVTQFEGQSIIFPASGSAINVHGQMYTLTSEAASFTTGAYTVIQQGSSFVLEDATTTITLGPGQATQFEGETVSYANTASAINVHGRTYTLTSTVAPITTAAYSVIQQGNSFVLKDATTTITLAPGQTTQFEGETIVYATAASAIVVHSSTYILSTTGAGFSQTSAPAIPATSSCVVASPTATPLCPAANGTLYTPAGQCTNSSASYFIVCGMDMSGGGIEIVPGVNSAQACMSQCSTDPTCVAVSFDTTKGSCLEKSSVVFGNATVSPGNVFAYNIGRNGFVVQGQSAVPNTITSTDSRPATGSGFAAASSSSMTGTSASSATSTNLVSFIVIGGTTTTTVIGDTLSTYTSGSQTLTTDLGGITTAYISGGSTTTTAATMPSSSVTANAVIGRCPQYNGLVWSSTQGTWLVACGTTYMGSVISTSTPQDTIPATAPAECETQCSASARCVGFMYSSGKCTYFGYINGTGYILEAAYAAIKFGGPISTSSVEQTVDVSATIISGGTQTSNSGIQISPGTQTSTGLSTTRSVTPATTLSQLSSSDSSASGTTDRSSGTTLSKNPTSASSLSTTGSPSSTASGTSTFGGPCPQYNGANYTDPQTVIYTMYCGEVYTGTPMSQTAGRLFKRQISPDDCLALCDQNPSCMAASSDFTTCKLYSTVSSRSPQPGAWAGVKRTTAAELTGSQSSQAASTPSLNLGSTLISTAPTLTSSTDSTATGSSDTIASSVTASILSSSPTGTLSTSNMSQSGVSSLSATFSTSVSSLLTSSTISATSSSSLVTGSSSTTLPLSSAQTAVSNSNTPTSSGTVASPMQSTAVQLSSVSVTSTYTYVSTPGSSTSAATGTSSTALASSTVASTGSTPNSGSSPSASDSGSGVSSIAGQSTTFLASGVSSTSANTLSSSSSGSLLLSTSSSTSLPLVSGPTPTQPSTSNPTSETVYTSSRVTSLTSGSTSAGSTFSVTNGLGTGSSSAGSSNSIASSQNSGVASASSTTSNGIQGSSTASTVTITTPQTSPSQGTPSGRRSLPLTSTGVESSNTGSSSGANQPTSGSNPGSTGSSGTGVSNTGTGTLSSSSISFSTLSGPTSSQPTGSPLVSSQPTSGSNSNSFTSSGSSTSNAGSGILSSPLSSLPTLSVATSSATTGINTGQNSIISGSLSSSTTSIAVSPSQSPGGNSGMTGSTDTLGTVMTSSSPSYSLTPLSSGSSSLTNSNTGTSSPALTASGSSSILSGSGLITATVPMSSSTSSTLTNSGTVQNTSGSSSVPSSSGGLTTTVPFSSGPAISTSSGTIGGGGTSSISSSASSASTSSSTITNTLSGSGSITSSTSMSSSTTIASASNTPATSVTSSGSTGTTGSMSNSNMSGSSSGTLTSSPTDSRLPTTIFGTLSSSGTSSASGMASSSSALSNTLSVSNTGSVPGPTVTNGISGSTISTYTVSSSSTTSQSVSSSGVSTTSVGGSSSINPSASSPSSTSSTSASSQSTSGTGSNSLNTASTSQQPSSTPVSSATSGNTYVSGSSSAQTTTISTSSGSSQALTPVPSSAASGNSSGASSTQPASTGTTSGTITTSSALSLSVTSTSSSSSTDSSTSSSTTLQPLSPKSSPSGSSTASPQTSSLSQPLSTSTFTGICANCNSSSTTSTAPTGSTTSASSSSSSSGNTSFTASSSTSSSFPMMSTLPNPTANSTCPLEGQYITESDGSQWLVVCYSTWSQQYNVPEIDPVQADNLTSCLDICSNEGTVCAGATWAKYGGTTAKCYLQAQMITSNNLATDGAVALLRRSGPSSGPQSVQLIVNGDFSSGSIAPWICANPDYTSSQPANNFTIQNGTAIWTFPMIADAAAGRFNGYYYAALYQRIQVSASQSYFFQAWMSIVQAASSGGNYGYCGVTITTDNGQSIYAGPYLSTNFTGYINGSGTISRAVRYIQFQTSCYAGQAPPFNPSMAFDNVVFYSYNGSNGTDPVCVPQVQVLQNNDFSSGNFSPWQTQPDETGYQNYNVTNGLAVIALNFSASPYTNPAILTQNFVSSQLTPGRKFLFTADAYVNITAASQSCSLQVVLDMMYPMWQTTTAINSTTHVQINTTGTLQYNEYGTFELIANCAGTGRMIVAWDKLYLYLNPGVTNTSCKTLTSSDGPVISSSGPISSTATLLSTSTALTSSLLSTTSPSSITTLTSISSTSTRTTSTSSSNTCAPTGAQPTSVCPGSDHTNITKADGSVFMIICDQDFPGNNIVNITPIVVSNLSACVDYCMYQGTMCAGVTLILSGMPSQTQPWCFMKSRMVPVEFMQSLAYPVQSVIRMSGPCNAGTQQLTNRGFDGGTISPWYTLTTDIAGGAFVPYKGIANVSLATGLLNGSGSDTATTAQAVTGVVAGQNYFVTGTVTVPTTQTYCDVIWMTDKETFAMHSFYSTATTSQLNASGILQYTPSYFAVKVLCQSYGSPKNTSVAVDNMGFYTFNPATGTRPLLPTPSQILVNNDFRVANFTPWTTMTTDPTAMNVSVVAHQAVFNYTTPSTQWDSLAEIDQAIYVQATQNWTMLADATITITGGTGTRCSLFMTVGGLVLYPATYFSSTTHVNIAKQGTLSSDSDIFLIRVECMGNATATITIGSVQFWINADGL